MMPIKLKFVAIWAIIINYSHSLRVPSETTKRIFGTLPGQGSVAGGAGGSSSLRGLELLDESWEKLRNGGWAVTPPELVVTHTEQTTVIDAELFDVAVSGGTLGIFYAIALQKMGKSCVVIERGRISGRSQEWNISRKELETLLRMGILTEEELKSCISIEFNPVRVGFNTDTSTEDTKTFNTWTTDVLNLGVAPDVLIEKVKNKFLEAGGVVKENLSLSKIDVYSNCASLSLVGATPSTVNARLVLDCMGNGSPIGKQIRGPVEPDGVCIVVGSCARGYQSENNTYSDLIYTDTPITRKTDSQMQYFWEAFPTGSDPTDRTTYLFTYIDAKKERPSVAEIFDDYWELLPRYQGMAVGDLQMQRILYGLFPTYRASPLKTTLNRILQVGDASGIQSPLSFGGFGSLTRHMERICASVFDALAGPEELLEAEYLSLINAYQPNLSACWMFQRAMSVPIGRNPKPDLVVGTLSNSFSSMVKLGDATMRPFLQDVLQFNSLLATLTKAAGQDLMTPFKIVPHVGLFAMSDFILHFFFMGVYTVLHESVGKSMVPAIVKMPFITPTQQFRLKRAAEAWKFGSGMDYYDH